MDYDVIIVGAGPAGSVTAYHLAARHHKVLVLDQSAFPRYKPCGGGIPLRTLDELPFDIKPVLEMNALGGKLTYRGRQKLVVSFNEEFAWLAMREKIDTFLLDQAVNAGAERQTDVRVIGIEENQEYVSVKTQKRTITGRYVVGADGVNSVVARSLGFLPNRKTGIALEAEIAVPETALAEQGPYATFDFGAIPAGYGWIFPKRNHLSVGVYHAKHSKIDRLKDYLNEFIASQPVLSEYHITSLRGHHIPLGEKSGPLNTNRCLLVGDAANLADPWLGEGIFYAVRSAVLASNTLACALRMGTGLGNYTDQINKEITEDFRYARRVARMVYRFPLLSTNIISRSQIMQKDMFINIRGDITFKQLWRRLFFKFPFILGQALTSRRKSIVP